MKKAVCIISALCAAAALLCSCGGTKLEKTDMDIASDTYKPSCAEPESAAIYDGILYTTCTDKVLSYDIENDEEKVLLDGLTDCRLITAGDGEVWIYESGGKMLMCFGVDGAEKRSYPLEPNQENTGFYDLTVTDNYAVLSEYTEDGKNSDLAVVDKKSGDCRRIVIDEYDYVISVDAAEKDNVVLTADGEAVLTFDTKKEEILDENYITGRFVDFADFNKERKTLYMSVNSRVTAGISSYSLADRELTNITRTGTVTSEDLENNYKYCLPLCICSEGNVLAWYDSDAGVYNIQNLDGDENRITVASVGFGESTEDAVDLLYYSFEKNTGTRVREIVYDTEEQMKTALMGGKAFDMLVDTDPFCIASTAFDDLYTYGAVAQKIEKYDLSDLFEKVAEKNGRLFGIPVGFRSDEYISAPISEENFNEYYANDPRGSWRRGRYTQDLLLRYAAEYVRLTDGECLDGDYSELRKTIKNAYDKKDVEYSDMIGVWSTDGDQFVSSYMMVCADSVNKDAAEKLLCEAIRLYCGDSGFDRELLFEGSINCFMYDEIDPEKIAYLYYENASDALGKAINKAAEEIKNGESGADETADELINTLDSMLKE